MIDVVLDSVLDRLVSFLSAEYKMYHVFLQFLMYGHKMYVENKLYKKWAIML